MAHAVAVAAEPAAKAAQQDNDQDDDEYHSKRHGTLLSRRPAGRFRGARPLSKAYPGRWFQRRNRRDLFRLQFQRRRIDAVAQTGRAGTVLEHMAEMAAA